MNHSAIELLMYNYYNNLYPNDFVYVYTYADMSNDLSNIAIDNSITKQLIYRHNHLPIFKKSSDSLIRHVLMIYFNVSNIDGYIYESFIDRMLIFNPLLSHKLRFDERIDIIFVINDKIINTRKITSIGNELVLMNTIDEINKLIKIISASNSEMISDIIANYDSLSDKYTTDPIIYALRDIVGIIDDDELISEYRNTINEINEGLIIDGNYLCNNLKYLDVKYISIEELVSIKMDHEMMYKYLCQ